MKTGAESGNYSFTVLFPKKQKRKCVHKVLPIRIYRKTTPQEKTRQRQNTARNLWKYAFFANPISPGRTISIPGDRKNAEL